MKTMSLLVAVCFFVWNGAKADRIDELVAKRAEFKNSIADYLSSMRDLRVQLGTLTNNFAVLCGESGSQSPEALTKAIDLVRGNFQKLSPTQRKLTKISMEASDAVNGTFIAPFPYEERTYGIPPNVSEPTRKIMANLTLQRAKINDDTRKILVGLDAQRHELSQCFDETDMWANLSEHAMAIFEIKRDGLGMQNFGATEKECLRTARAKLAEIIQRVGGVEQKITELK